MDQETATGEIWRAVSELFFSAENQAKFKGAAIELGLTPPMLKALLEFEPGEAVPMRSLAAQWHCDASFVTVVVDGLERPGYVERRVASHDRRVKTVQLTRAGVDARARAVVSAYSAPTGFWDLRPDEQETLARLLRKLADAQAAYDAMIVGAVEPSAPAVASAADVGADLATDPGAGDPAVHEPEGWRARVDAHQRELHELRGELARVRDELEADVKAELRALKAEFEGQLVGRPDRAGR